MYDLHCHLLPGIDDGPQTLEQALELAQCAVDNGITHAVVTPHIHHGRYENTGPSIKQHFVNYQQAVKDAGISLKLGFAGEVRLGFEVIQMAQEGLLPFYGHYQGHNILLLEMPHSHVPPGSDKLVEWLLKHNIKPMIAHPERNKDVMRNSKKLEPFLQLGCLLQITADSVAGSFGEQAEYIAHQLVAEGHATILASDGHNLKHRPPRLKPGLHAATKLIGEQEATALVLDTPKAISLGQFCDA